MSEIVSPEALRRQIEAHEASHSSLFQRRQAAMHTFDELNEQLAESDRIRKELYRQLRIANQPIPAVHTTNLPPAANQQPHSSAVLAVGLGNSALTGITAQERELLETAKRLEKYPTVVRCDDGTWRELLCNVCKGNLKKNEATGEKTFIRGTEGFQDHLSFIHDTKSTREEILVQCLHRKWSVNEILSVVRGDRTARRVPRVHGRVFDPWSLPVRAPNPKETAQLSGMDTLASFGLPMIVQTDKNTWSDLRCGWCQGNARNAEQSSSSEDLVFLRGVEELQGHIRQIHWVDLSEEEIYIQCLHRRWTTGEVLSVLRKDAWGYPDVELIECSMQKEPSNAVLQGRNHGPSLTSTSSLPRTGSPSAPIGPSALQASDTATARQAIRTSILFQMAPGAWDDDTSAPPRSVGSNSAPRSRHGPSPLRRAFSPNPGPKSSRASQNVFRASNSASLPPVAQSQDSTDPFAAATATYYQANNTISRPAVNPGVSQNHTATTNSDSNLSAEVQGVAGPSNTVSLTSAAPLSQTGSTVPPPDSMMQEILAGLTRMARLAVAQLDANPPSLAESAAASAGVPETTEVIQLDTHSPALADSADAAPTTPASSGSNGPAASIPRIEIPDWLGCVGQWASGQYVELACPRCNANTKLSKHPEYFHRSHGFAYHLREHHGEYLPEEFKGRRADWILEYCGKRVIAVDELEEVIAAGLEGARIPHVKPPAKEQPEPSRARKRRRKAY
ncbi:hypothetical protein BU16DRAFT_580090 [Lophium mytilinum]|uniref:Uncharacterized protein n=1 Tax=Lophium mytilinum TaxID=390894 RepID=A0A6A6QY74_9PEZI|nr:hypothetical protein BU16DRAFT_580090 [Lophium mytilinum]